MISIIIVIRFYSIAICMLYHAFQGLCKIHEGMFDKPEGVARGFITLPECFCIDPWKAWYS